MIKEDCFYLGIIARKHSYKGKIVIVIDSDEPELYANIDAVFIEINSKLIPYFIEEIKLQKGNQLRIKFEDIDSEEDAGVLLKRPTFLPLSLLPKLEGNKFYYHEVIGFDLEDINYGHVGKITAVNDNSSQAFFVIQHNTNQVLIPIIDTFLKKIDRKNNKIIVTTPEGLIQMNLEES